MNLSHGPIELPKETEMHMFFECPAVRDAAPVGNGTEWVEWSQKELLNPTSTNTTTRRMHLMKAWSTLYRVWKCKLSYVKPTKSRLRHDCV